MIKIKRIKEHSDLDSLEINNYDVVFYGEAIDDRTRKIVNEIEIGGHGSAFHIMYNSDDIKIKLNHKDEYNPIRFHAFFSEHKFNSIFIDSTSIDFPELVYLLFAISTAKLKCPITISYLEPYDYKHSTETCNNKAGIQEQEFILSDKKGKFSYLPLFAVNSSQTEKATLVTTLGFESSRLGQLLEQDDGYAYEGIEAYIGLPAYKPGWENRAIYKHMRYLSPDKAELNLYPACNPYEFLKQLRKLLYTYSDQPIVFAPMGTKPAVLAISLLLVNGRRELGSNFKFGALYDFPKKSQNRSNGVGKVFSYELQAS
ncbi:hypothetical protein AB6C71_06385 [Vibrio splendidus]